MSETGHEGARVEITREEGFRFKVRGGGDRPVEIITDEPPPLGSGAGPSPSELLAAAVGSCLASSLLFCLQKARLEVKDLEADVTSTMVRDPKGRLRIGGMRVRLAPSVDPGVREKMDRCLEIFESFCTVTQSVRRGVDVTVEVEPRIVAATGDQGSPAGHATSPPAAHR